MLGRDELGRAEAQWGAPPTGGPGKLGQEGCFSQSGAACEQAEVEAVRLANEMKAEYWSVSAKTGEWVRGWCPSGHWQFPLAALWHAGDHAGSSTA